MQIKEDDLTGSDILELLYEHLCNMHELSPPESVHALDLEQLKRQDITFWTAWDNGVLMGFGALKELDPWHGEIKSMRTPSNRRRHGVGRLLLQHIIAVAQQRGYRLLSLETGSQPGFEPARTLYESHGFTYTGPFAEYAEDPHSRFMQLRLSRGGPAVDKDADRLQQRLE